MAALIPKPDPDCSTAAPDAVATVRVTSPARTTVSDCDALLRDLLRALARSAAREAWASACSDNSDSQDPTS
jgi:hypothetical protein